MFDNRKSRKRLIKDTESFVNGWLIFGFVAVPSIFGFIILVSAFITENYSLLIYLLVLPFCFVAYAILSKFLLIRLGYYYDKVDKTMVYLKKNEQFIEKSTSGVLRCEYKSKKSECTYLKGTKAEIKEIKNNEATIIVKDIEGKPETLVVELDDVDLD